MRIPKRYGQSRVERCPFCGRQGVSKNPQGVPVCSYHKSELVSELRCACGFYADIRTGKWGAYASCTRCGNMNLGRILELNPQKPSRSEKREAAKQAGTTVRSDELDFLY